VNYIWFYLLVLVINPSQLNLENYKIIYDREDYIKVIESRDVEENLIKDPVVVEKIIREDKIIGKEYPTSGVEEYIEKYSEKYGVNVVLAKKIAWCESNYYSNAKNTGSSAEGVFQFIDGTWMHTMELMGIVATTERKMEVPISIEAGIFLLAEEGSGHWNASKHCWGKL